MVGRTFDCVLKHSAAKSWRKKSATFFGKYVKQVGLFGISVELEIPEADLQSLVHGFAPHLRKLLAELRNEQQALLILLDDITGLVESTALANWLNSMVDEIPTSGNSVSARLVVVGLEERRQQLIRLQPLVAQVFDLVEIRPWFGEETADLFVGRLALCESRPKTARWM